MWLNISGANGEPTAIPDRDQLASKMSPADLSEAQRRAKACMASEYQDCE
jgi:hypothetical protein